MVVADLSLANHHVVREHAAHGLVKSATDGLVGHMELGPGPGPAGINLLERLIHEVEGRRGGVGLEIGPRPVALQGVTPPGNRPLQLDLWQRARPGQVDLDAPPGRLDVTDVHEAGQGRDPETSEWPSTGVERPILLGPRSNHRGDMTHVYFPWKSRFCGLGAVVWFQGCR